MTFCTFQCRGTAPSAEHVPGCQSAPCAELSWSSLAQTWSLAIEEHFYIFLSLILVWAARKKLSPVRILQVLGALCVLALVLRTNDAIHGRLGPAFNHTQNRMDSLLYGVMLATIYWMLPETFAALTRRKWPLIAGSLCCWC